MSIADRRDFVSALAKEARVDERGLYAREAATWPDLKKAAGKGLVRIGAHTIRHPPLSALSAQEAHAEIADGRTRLEKNLGQEVRHFAYRLRRQGLCRPARIRHDARYWFHHFSNDAPRPRV